MRWHKHLVLVLAAAAAARTTAKERGELVVIFVLAPINFHITKFVPIKAKESSFWVIKHVSKHNIHATSWRRKLAQLILCALIDGYESFAPNFISFGEHPGHVLDIPVIVSKFGIQVAFDCERDSEPNVI